MNLFEQETFLINRLAKYEQGLVKRADLFQTLGLDSAGDTLKSFFADHFHNSDELPGGYFTSFVSLLVPSVLWRINPLFGIIAVIADQFGLNFELLIKKIVEALRPKIEAGEPISPEEVNSLGESLGGMPAEAFVKNLEKLVKLAALRRYRWDVSSPKYEIPFLSGGQGGLIQRIFGNLTEQKGRRLLIGFIIWIVKTALAGAGLMAGGALVSKILGHKRPDRIVEPEAKPEEKPKESIEPKESVEPKEPPKEVERKAPSFKIPELEKSRKIWMVPLIRDVENTLKVWIFDLYPELEQYPNIEEKIHSSSGFQRMVDKLDVPSNIGGGKLVMPSQYSSRRQVVNEFISEIK